MPFTSKDIGYCIVDATSHPVKIALHKLILNQIFVKPGLNGLKPAKLKLAIVLERKNNSTLIIMILIIIIMIIMIIIIIRRTTTLGMVSVSCQSQYLTLLCERYQNL